MFSIVNLSKKETCIKGYEAFLKCAWSVVNFIQKKMCMKWVLIFKCAWKDPN